MGIEKTPWMGQLYEKQQVLFAFHRVTGQIFPFNTVLKEAVNQMSEDDQIKMITEAELSFELIDNPSERLKRLHELKWKL